MTLRELRQVTREKIVTIETTPWNPGEKSVRDIKDEKSEYIGQDIKIDDGKLVVEVTHLTYLII